MSKVKKEEALPPDRPEKGFEFDNEIYSKVSCAAKLQEVKLVGSSYLVRPEVFGVVEDIANMDLRYSGECSSFSLEADEGIAFGQFQWAVEIKSGRKSCLKLKSEYLVVYTNLQDCEEGHVRYFFTKVGRFATYPYFRSHFSHHTSETGVILPPLPTLRERVD